jgi:hypothetical protein
MATYWKNDDGLLIKYGASEGAILGVTGIGWAAEYSQMADGQHCVEVVLQVMTAIPSSAASGAGIVSDSVVIPSGARIEKVKVVTTTACTGAGAVLNLGLVDQDRTTEIDYNGLIAALALTEIDTVGDTTILQDPNDTYVGALLGTTTSNAGYISVDYDTAAYTAGIVKIYVYFSMPYSTTSP